MTDEKLFIRKAESRDLDRILEIYSSAHQIMKENGNPDQWGDHYPPKQLVISDISEGKEHIITDGSEIYAVFAVCPGPEHEYGVIENGAWLNEMPYIAVHRVAGDGRLRGIVHRIAEFMKDKTGNIRIDTHEDNLLMQKAVEKEGFVRCGQVYMDDGSPRVAYHWSDITS